MRKNLVENKIMRNKRLSSFMMKVWTLMGKKVVVTTHSYESTEDSLFMSPPPM